MFLNKLFLGFMISFVSITYFSQTNCCLKPEFENITSDCPICFEEIKPEDNKKLACCFHDFHQKCISEWEEALINQEKVCAYCKQKIDFIENYTCNICNQKLDSSQKMIKFSCGTKEKCHFDCINDENNCPSCKKEFIKPIIKNNKKLSIENRYKTIFIELISSFGFGLFASKLIQKNNSNNLGIISTVTTISGTGYLLNNKLNQINKKRLENPRQTTGLWLTGLITSLIIFNWNKPEKKEKN